MVALVYGAAGTVAVNAWAVRAAEAVEMFEVVHAGTVAAAGTAEVAELEAVGRVEALGRQLLCAMAEGPVCSRVSAACFVVPAPFSGAGLL